MSSVFNHEYNIDDCTCCTSYDEKGRYMFKRCDYCYKLDEKYNKVQDKYKEQDEEEKEFQRVFNQTSNEYAQRANSNQSKRPASLQKIYDWHEQEDIKASINPNYQQEKIEAQRAEKKRLQKLKEKERLTKEEQLSNLVGIKVGCDYYLSKKICHRIDGKPTEDLIFLKNHLSKYQGLTWKSVGVKEALVYELSEVGVQKNLDFIQSYLRELKRQKKSQPQPEQYQTITKRVRFDDIVKVKRYEQYANEEDPIEKENSTNSNQQNAPIEAVEEPQIQSDISVSQNYQSLNAICNELKQENKTLKLEMEAMKQQLQQHSNNLEYLENKMTDRDVAVLYKEIGYLKKSVSVFRSGHSKKVIEMLKDTDNLLALLKKK